MELSSEIYFVLIGIVLTGLTDIYLSSSSSFLVLLAAVRILSIGIALAYRVFYDRDPDRTNTYWNTMKNMYVVVATVEQACIFYHLEFEPNLWSILYIIQQVSMPLLSYLWIRRIERENFSALQQIWTDVMGSKVGPGKPSFAGQRRLIERNH